MTPIHHVITAKDRTCFKNALGREPFEFWDIHTGFDTIKFEDVCFPNLPDGTSCADAVAAMNNRELSRVIAKMLAGRVSLITTQT